MDLQQIIAYVGTLGLGGLLGMAIKSLLDIRMQNRRMLFEARTKAYAGITSRIFNLFQEPDIHDLPDKVKFVRITAILSEVMLIGSGDLVRLVYQYKIKIHQYHVALSENDHHKQRLLYRDLTQLAGKIHLQMRMDLHVETKELLDMSEEVEVSTP